MADWRRLLWVALACAGLAACQAHAPRRVADVPAADTAVDPGSHAGGGDIPLHNHPPASKARAPGNIADSRTTGETAAEGDVWQRLRASFVMPGCDYTPGVQHWVRRHAGSPRRFAAQLSQMLPAIEYTQRQLAQASIPGEFALLPVVESHYHPFPGGPDRPAGIWQMIAATGRAGGLRVDAWFDGRLNLAASTAAAVVLLDRYAEQFGEDWRLVAFAYNAGEYRVRRALERHKPGDHADSLQALGMPRTSLEYLDKLLALSCLVREPERVGLELPALPAGQQLVELELDGAVGLSLARALSGMDRDEFARRNGGMLKGRTPPGDRLKLLVPAHRLDDARRALAGIPAARRMEWQQQHLASPDELQAIAAENGLDTGALLALNGLDNLDADIAGQRLWLPGAGGGNGDVAAGAQGSGTVHVVRSGDSLWQIARRHGLTVAELLRYNRMNDTRIKPGQRLRLSAP
ncbi:hypothetical protein B1808_07310 [Pseudofulvimonas gallinarii]|uniref:Membrane-bound lytic murein transglycosylase D n=1 Tax=Pseudofulvimonas gallinarii TaxID=634155 RepID=A0A4S3KWK5_9GAMM|nr:membrane-bound lytic murein transglycosylase D [Pseudofulvimonas gallinarii]THD13546.1 hypothetical protein B1808_07310 [Pseudofulvimonas gallinarii]